jgi:hypothetical protein
VHVTSKIILNNVPTSFKKDPRKAIGAGGLVTRNLLDRVANLLFRERVPHGFQVWVVEMNSFPIKVNRARVSLPHDQTKVVEDDLLFSLMVGDPTVAVLDMLNDIFSSSSIDMKMEELGVCISLM